MQVTEAQHIAACEVAAQVYSKQMSGAEGARMLATKHGLNVNSARDFIDDYRHLARGEVFQRAMSGAAMKHFMEQVALREGPLARGNAIRSLQAHIKYYEQDGKRTHMMRSVLAAFQGEQSNPAVDEVVESAISEIDDAVDASSPKPTGQGYGLSAAERRAVELAAMKVAEAQLHQLGFTHIDNVAQFESCDFRAVLEGEEWFVEVKGTTNPHADQILLTANEAVLHQEHSLRSCLIVVAGIKLDRAAVTATGGSAVVFKPWGTAGWKLAPIAYRAVRVSSDPLQ